MLSLPNFPSAVDRVLLRSLTAVFGRAVEESDLAPIAGIPDPAIYAFNHNNSFEVLAVPPKLIRARGDRPIHFFVDWMFLHIPVIGWILRHGQPIPVYTKPARFRIGERYRQSRLAVSPLDTALDLLAEGRCVGIFPEGTRNPDPSTLRRGRLGLGHLIALSDAPVVPIGIAFVGAANRRRVPHIGRIRVRIGEPLAFRDRRARLREVGSAPERRAVLRRVSREVIDLTMLALSALSGKAYPHGGQREVGAGGLEPASQEA